MTGGLIAERILSDDETERTALDECGRQDGAGIITSLTETDRLSKLPEEATASTPGDGVGFLS